MSDQHPNPTEETAKPQKPLDSHHLDAFEPEIQKTIEGDDPFCGKLYGKWKLLRRIGMGGVGYVYLAEHTQDRRTAAVKLLKDTFTQHPILRARFKREADLTTNRLNHPNVLRGHLMGEQAGVQYFVAEYIDGDTLEERIIRDKVLKVPDAIGIMEDIFSGLQHTHEKGVVHRDLKPANIMFQRGRVKLIDYGLAKDATATKSLTVVGRVMGTPAFMSPEQARGERGDHLSDIYACGILLFVMLTGHKPFGGASNEEICRKQIHEAPPAAHVFNRDVTPKIEMVINRLLEKDPAKRFQNTSEARSAMRAAIKGTSVERAVPKRQPGPPSRLPAVRKAGPASPKLPILIAVGVGVLVLILILIMILSA